MFFLVFINLTVQSSLRFVGPSTRSIVPMPHCTPAETNEVAKQIEKAFILLPDVEAIHQEWKRLVLVHGVSGAKVHDARIVAAMIVHGVRQILTLNGSDFDRYTEIVTVSPQNIPA